MTSSNSETTVNTGKKATPRLPQKHKPIYWTTAVHCYMKTYKVHIIKIGDQKPHNLHAISN